MALYTTRGTISEMYEISKGTTASGRDWKKMMVVLEMPGYQGQVTKQAFTAFGDKALLCDSFKAGDEVVVVWSMYAREWNGNYYTNVDLVNIQTPEQAEQRREQEQPRQTRRSPIYDKINAQAAPAPEDDPDKDLPF